MNRRNLLTATAASMMLPGAAVVERGGRYAHPDALLIAACSEFLRIQRAHEAYCATLPDDLEDDEEDAKHEAALLTPMPALVEQIVALRATTAEGHLARARCTAFHWLPQAKVCQDDPEDAPDERFRTAELRDLVAMERGPASGGRGADMCPPPDAGLVQASEHSVQGDHPDAGLFAACAAAVAAWDAINTMPHGQPDEVWEALTGKWADARDVVADIRARTRAGCVAKARILILEMDRDPDEGNAERWLAWQLANDVLSGLA